LGSALAAPAPRHGRRHGRELVDIESAVRASTRCPLEAAGNGSQQLDGWARTPHEGSDLLFVNGGYEVVGAPQPDCGIPRLLVQYSGTPDQVADTGHCLSSSFDAPLGPPSTTTLNAAQFGEVVREALTLPAG
jgi:hypothetical protein